MRYLGLISVVLVVAACTQTDGTVSTSGQRLGERTFELDRCVSGMNTRLAGKRGFEGVELFASHEPSTRLRLRRGEKVLVSVVEQDGTEHAIDPSGCESFDAVVERQSRQRDQTYSMCGHARLRCPELTADVTFSSCFEPD